MKKLTKEELPEDVQNAMRGFIEAVEYNNGRIFLRCEELKVWKLEETKIRVIRPTEAMIILKP